MKTRLFLISAALLAGACSQPAASNSAAASPSRPTASPTTATPQAVATSSPIEDGDYPGKGTVTKINDTLGSVEMDHDDIPGLMPAMRMEFYVSDKKLLNGLKVGDPVEFTIRYKGGSETIVKLKKEK